MALFLLLLLLCFQPFIPSTLSQTPDEAFAAATAAAAATVVSVPRPHLHRLPYCASQLGHTSPHAVELDQLRDLIQRIQQLQRAKNDIAILLSRKIDPPKDKGEQHAFNTSLTQDQLSAQLQLKDKEIQAWEAKMREHAQQLQAQGVLAQGMDWHRLTSCVMGRLNPHLYPDKPQVSFMLQYFKRPWMIGQIVDRIRGCQQFMKVELVVNADEPSDHAAWAELAANSSGLVVPVFSSNVHEIRAYNRLGDLATGKYLITHQDDELMPPSCAWLNDVVAIMDAHSSLGALGLKGFIFSMGEGNINAGEHFKDRKLNLNMQFVGRVDFSPMVIRKSAFKHVGGLDEGLSNAGECGIWSDWELSSRLWAAGWQVGFHFLPNRGNDASGHASGTHTPENGHRCWGRQQGVAMTVYNNRWGEPFQEEVSRLVKRLNFELLEPIFPKCPFGKQYGGCDLWLDTYPPAKIPSLP